MYIKVKPKMYCSNCGAEIDSLEVNKEDRNLSKYVFKQETIFNPSHCPKCGEKVEGFFLDNKDFSFMEGCL